MSKTGQLKSIEIKLENNDLQTYLDSFNKEIEEGNQTLASLTSDLENTMASDGKSANADDSDDDKVEDEETGTFFIDQSGNYYYQASKDSEPVLTEAPEHILGDSDRDAPRSSTITSQIRPYRKIISNNRLVKSSGSDAGNNDDDEDADVDYMLILDNDKSQNDDDDNDASDDPDNEVYDFNEDEDKVFSKDDIKFVVPTIRLKKKTPKSNVENTHQCTHCEYVTSRRYLLARHMKCHSDDRPYKCSVCERGFKTTASLQNHVNTHTGTKPHSCKSCDATFTTSGELVRHIRYRHTHEKPHKCSECDYASVELSKLKRHIRCHTGERPFQCPHCTYASPDTFKLKRHLRTHTGEKPYECDICQARFTQSNSLKAHKMIHSVGDKPIFQCSLCPTTCGRKTDLRIHVQKLHSTDRPINCKRCGKKFPDRYSYKVHVKTHEGEKCFKCNLCPYASISQRHLESHQLIHTDEKPFECLLCDLTFRQKQLLKRHINLYHNKDYVAPTPKEKNHSCPHCKRKFSHKGNLMRHMVTHDPESDVSQQKLKLKIGRMTRILTDSDNDNVDVINEIDEMDDDQEDDSQQDYVDEEEIDGDQDENVEYELDEEECVDDVEVTQTYVGGEENFGNSASEEVLPDFKTVTIKKEDNGKEFVAVEGIDGQQYMVVEVLQCEEDNEDVVRSSAINRPPTKNSYSVSRKNYISHNDKQHINQSVGMDSYFGFSESEENMAVDDSVNDDIDTEDNKETIELLQIMN